MNTQTEAVSETPVIPPKPNGQTAPEAKPEAPTEAKAPCTPLPTEAPKATASKPVSAPRKAVAKAKATTAAKAKATPLRTAATAGKPKAKAKATITKRGGGKALTDFANEDRLRLIKASEIPEARRDCFRTGRTVLQTLEAMKLKELRGRRKYIRTQIAQGRVALKTEG